MERRTPGTQLREYGAAEDGRTIIGIAVPWNTPTELPGTGVRETFARGSVQASDVIGLPLLYRHGDPVGKVIDAEDTARGLEVRARVANTRQGSELLTLVREGVLEGLSIGFDPVEDSWNQIRDAVTRVKVKAREISAAVFPVHETATITAVREQQTEKGNRVATNDAASADQLAQTEAKVSELREKITADATKHEATVSELREQIGTLAAELEKRPAVAVRESLPWQTEHDFWADYARNVSPNAPAEQRERFASQVRALTVVDAANDATEFTSGQTWTDGLLGLINNGRRTVTAIGTSPLAATGLTVDYIETTTGVTTGDQATEVAEVTSTAYESTARQASVFTEAGANRVSFQLLQRSSPDFRTELMRDYARAYAARWNARAVALLGTATQTDDWNIASGATLDNLGTFLASVATKVSAGSDGDLDVVILAPDFYFRLGIVAGQGYPLAGGTAVGNMGLASGAFSALGTTFVRDNALTAGTGYAVNRASVGLKESPGAPFSIESTVAGNLATDVAVYGYGATYLRRANGVSKLTMTLV